MLSDSEERPDAQLMKTLHLNTLASDTGINPVEQQC
jgi:hypothetical protein